MDCDPSDDSCDRGVLDPVDCICKPAGTNQLESIEIIPDDLSIEPGDSRQLLASGTFDSGDVVDVTRSVTWASSDTNVVTVEDLSGVITGVAEGTSTISASSGSVRGETTVIVVSSDEDEQCGEDGCPPCSYCDEETGECILGCLSNDDCPDGLACGEGQECVEDGTGEVRGLWVTRWNYSSPAHIQTIFENSERAGINTVFFQVRGQGDAYYDSAHEPWANIGGAGFGQDPGWDPLALALSEGAERGIDVHAWINAIPAWMGASPPPESTPRHKVLSNPEWLMVDSSGRRQQVGDSGYIAFSPGIPEVVDHIAAVVTDIVEKYPVAGVHLDYIRYIGRQFSHDPVSNQRFEAASASDPSLTRDDWQREQINEVVRRSHEAVSVRPGVVLTAASWHNHNLDVFGSSGYRDYYQDAHAWLERGTVDALVPMNYFRLDSNPSFIPMADDHVAAAHASGRHVYMGVHVLGRGNAAERDDTGARMAENIEYSRSIGAHGTVLFAYPYLVENDLWDFLGQGVYGPPDPSIPAMPWLECPE